MIKSTNSISHTFDDARLSLMGTSLSVTDSNSGDSISINDLDRLQIAKEVRYFVRYCAASHNETERQRKDMQAVLSDIATAAQTVIEEMQPTEVQA